MSSREILLNKLKGKQYIEKYLSELNLLVNEKISVDNLKSLEETFEIIERSKSAIQNIPVYKERIFFNDKRALNTLLLGKSDKGFYLFTDYSKYCGTIYLKNLDLFNMNFNFQDEHAGVVSFIAEDFTEKILLDFYEENSDLLMEIEFYKSSS